MKEKEAIKEKGKNEWKSEMEQNGWSRRLNGRRFNKLVGMLWKNASFKSQGLDFLLTFFITFVGKGTSF